MSRADVITLAQAIANQQCDATSIQRYYDDITYDLANREIIVNDTLIAVTKDDPTITLPDSAVDVLAAFYDDKILSVSNVMDLSYTAGQQWRDISGSPVALIREAENARNFVLFPKPDRDNETLAYPHGQPFGVDFPGAAVALIHTEKRDDVPIYLELPVAFLILEREFSRESDHKDLNFASICGQIGTFLMNLVEIEWP